VQVRNESPETIHGLSTTGSVHDSTGFVTTFVTNMVANPSTAVLAPSSEGRVCFDVPGVVPRASAVLQIKVE